MSNHPRLTNPVKAEISQGKCFYGGGKEGNVWETNFGRGHIVSWFDLGTCSKVIKDGAIG